MQEDAILKFFGVRTKSAAPKEDPRSGALKIKVDSIMPNPYQPRRHFDVSGLEELANSIKQVGVITPISVRRAPGGYELICGERRLRAAKIAGLTEIPAIIMELSDKESAIVAITENLQRRDLSFFEEAESIRNLIEFHGVTQEMVAEKLGKSQAAIANKLRLLKLSEPVRRVITDGGLHERHARALLRLPNEEMQLAAARRAAELQLNVAATEKMVQKMLEEEPQKRMFRRDLTLFEKKTRLFKNTVTKTLEMLKKGGISPTITENEGDGFVEYTIKLEKERGA